MIPFKKTNDIFKIPVLGIGTWKMGGMFDSDPKSDDNADVKALKKAIDLGITHIDTSETYANGRAEEIISKAIKGYDRSKLFIVSKVWAINLHYGDVIKSAERSLKRLGTDYLDLYLIHFPNPDIPIKETMEAFDFLKENKLIKYIGLSNFNTEQFIEAQKCTNNKIVANQVYYNLINREYEKNGFLNYAQSNNIIFIAWRPIQEGILIKKGIKIIDDMCKKYDKTPAQIAINWLISQDNVVTLVKTSNIGHLIENLGAVGWQMESEDIEVLRTNFPGQKFISAESFGVDIYEGPENIVKHN